MDTRRVILGGIAVVAAAAVAAALLMVLTGSGGTRITAYFNHAVGVYVGSDVRILGVKTGEVTEVEPEGGRVRTVISVDDGVDVPASARAVVIAPSLVADRYIQLTPAYTGGERAKSGLVIKESDTVTPLELDQVYAAITKLAKDLGPDGVNKDGSFSRALKVGAENMRGNGKALNSTVSDLGKAARTLAGSRGDLFATIENLQKFTSMLAANDGEVRKAEQQMAEVTKFLADDKETLAAALRELSIALGKVKTFIADNREEVAKNVRQLASITQILVNQRKSLAEAVDVQPLNVQNVLNAYDPVSRSLMGRSGLHELPMPSAGTTTQGGGG